jgi:hypothetical protein
VGCGLTSKGRQGEGEERASRRWSAGAAFGVLFVLVIAYYAIHKPIDIAQGAALAADALRMVLAVAIVIAAGAIGRRMMGEVGLGPAASASVQAALGLGVSGIAWLIIGASLGFAAWLAWLILVAAILLLRRSSLDWLRQVGAGVSSARPRGAFDTALAIAVGLLLAVGLLDGLGPPVQFDALVYHLSLPQTFLDAGRFIFDPANPFWGSPLLVEMNNTWAMALGGGASTATVLGVLVGAMTLLGVYGLTSRLAPRAAWAATASLLAGQTLWSSLGSGYVDWYAAFFGLGMLACLLAWQSEHSSGLAAWAGAFAGLAMGTKYTAGALLVAGFAVLWINGDPSRRTRAALGFVIAAVAAFAAWPVKNLIATGAPLYPYLGANAWVSSLQQAFFSGTSSAGFQPVGPFIPLFATIYGVEGAPGYAASIGPLLLGLSLAAFVGSIRRREPSGLLVTFLVTGWLVWGGASFVSELLGQSRLYMAFFPAWAVLAGLGFSRLLGVRLGTVRLGRLTQAIVITTIALTLMAAARSAAKNNPLLPALGLESQPQTLARRLGAYAPAMTAARDLDGAGSVVMLWEPRGYYCQPECLPDAWIDRWYSLRRAGLNDAEIVAGWRADGRSYVLLNRAGMEFIREQDTRYEPADWAALEDLLARLKPLNRFGDAYVLYGIP